MDTNSFSQRQWTSREALILMALCLSIGIGGGWLIRNMRQSGQSAIVPVSAPAQAAPASQKPAPAELKSMADTQAAPLLGKLKSDPQNPEILTSIGNLYYDAQQYPAAIDFYNRALQTKPSDSAVRTDMATAYWYLGNSDAAIAEFNKALAYAPTNPNTLFNLGLVKWQGKHDSAGAIADWKKLLATNPNYEGKDKVQQMLDQVEKQTSAKPAAKG
jgi:cytochrome c-type biogenesis protein CcmH/NrfG